MNTDNLEKLSDEVLILAQLLLRKRERGLVALKQSSISPEVKNAMLLVFSSNISTLEAINSLSKSDREDVRAAAGVLNWVWAAQKK